MPSDSCNHQNHLRPITHPAVTFSKSGTGWGYNPLCMFLDCRMTAQNQTQNLLNYCNFYDFFPSGPAAEKVFILSQLKVSHLYSKSNGSVIVSLNLISHLLWLQPSQLGLLSDGDGSWWSSFNRSWPHKNFQLGCRNPCHRVMFYFFFADAPRQTMLLSLWMQRLTPIASTSCLLRTELDLVLWIC